MRYVYTGPGIERLEKVEEEDEMVAMAAAAG